MKILNTQVQKLLLATLGLSALMLPTTVTSAPGNLATQPIFTQNAINPNIILGIDDSGSMDGEVLMQTNDGAFWWNTSEETFVGWLGQPGSSTGRGVATPGLPNFNINGSANSRWKKYTYLFPNGTGTGNRVYNDSTNAHFAIPPVIQYAFMRSPDYNSAFFDPTITYKPWVSYTTKTFTDIADETMAPSDPFRGSATFDLTDTTTESTSSNFTFFSPLISMNWLSQFLK